MQPQMHQDAGHQDQARPRVQVAPGPAPQPQQLLLEGRVTTALEATLPAQEEYHPRHQRRQAGEGHDQIQRIVQLAPEELLGRSQTLVRNSVQKVIDPPPLPNLDFKIEAGDSLTGPDPSGGIQPDLFRQRQVEDFFRLKADFLMAHGGEKLGLRKKIEQQRREIAAWAHPKGGDGGFDWAVEFAEVFTPADGGGRRGGFDIVLANPPYVRADAQYKHVADEGERQAAIARWQGYREALKKNKVYRTLYEKWDLYVPFLERAWQLLRPGGQMVFIIPDAYNAAKYPALWRGD